MRMELEIIVEFGVRKICCLDEELNRVKIIVVLILGFIYKIMWGRFVVIEWRKFCV